MNKPSKTALLSGGAGLLVGIVLSAAMTCGSSDRHSADEKHANHEGSTSVWTCSMHPQIHVSQAGPCPICGMDLIKAEQSTSAFDSDQERRAVTLSKHALALAQVRTSVVHARSISGGLELLGEVVTDESTLKTLSAWTAGRLDRLYVQESGQRVKRGQRLASIYSPELYSAHQDLITAARQVDALQQSSPLVRQGAERALQATKKRLELLGLSSARIDGMANESSPRKTFPVTATASGTVLERNVAQGDYVSVGQPLFRIANLTKLWVELDVYESQRSMIKVGDEVSLRIAALRDKTFGGRVAFINPKVDPIKRTTKVRVEVDNKERTLSPGMFVVANLTDVAPTFAAQAQLLVPASAPLITGKRAVVFVQPTSDTPRYVARDVTLGLKEDDHYVVLSGLRAGERVVTRGAFLLDADLQIRGEISVMNTAEHDSESNVKEAGMARRQELSEAAFGSWGSLVQSYLEVQNYLSADDWEAAKRAANSAKKPNKRKVSRDVYNELSAVVIIFQELSSATSLEATRRAFRALSTRMIAIVGQYGSSSNTDLFVASCPMAFDGEDDEASAEWLQNSEVVKNPYLGTSMPNCGQVNLRIRAANPHAGHGTKDTVHE